MENILITAGVVCLVAAFTAGGLKLAGNEVPKLESLGRQLAVGALGAIFFAIGLWIGSSSDRSTDRPAISSGNKSISAETETIDNETGVKTGSDNEGEPAKQAEENVNVEVKDTSGDELIAHQGYIYLGIRDAKGWIKNRYAPKGAIVSEKNIPSSGQYLEVIEPVHLRKNLPLDDFPTNMVSQDDLGVLTVGTVVKIGRVKIVASKFYWSSVLVSSSEGG